MKRRLDVLLVEKGLTESREKAQALILAGKVLVEGKTVSKPGAFVHPEANIEVKEGLPYVSRGGLKLEFALKTFGVDPSGKVAIDVGASTGGFTDCLLQHGASKVYAVDVGYGQLAWKLRQDPRVVILERTNIRYLTSLPELVDLATIDVSFISLRLVLPPVLNLLKPKAEVVALIKPQFEAGREKVGKKGVVRDPQVHREVLESLVDFAQDLGLSTLGLTVSPLLGPEGNVEFFAYWARGVEARQLDLAKAIEDCVEKGQILQRGAKIEQFCP
jgi:23S rRNA (cytidine1920-2'-O)/16S rRNA (cytidine1409-2'-O)-methyltransferase